MSGVAGRSREWRTQNAESRQAGRRMFKVEGLFKPRVQKSNRELTNKTKENQKQNY